MKILITFLIAILSFTVSSTTVKSMTASDNRPSVYFGTNSSGEMKVNDIKKTDQIVVKDNAGNTYEIIKFSMVFQKKDGPMQMEIVNGGGFNDRVKSLLAQTEEGSTIIFTDIHYLNKKNKATLLGKGIEIKAIKGPVPIAYFGNKSSGSMDLDDLQDVGQITVRDSEGKAYENLRFTMVYQTAKKGMEMDKALTGSFSTRMKQFIMDAKPGDTFIITDINVRDGEDGELHLDNGIVIQVR